MKICNNCRHYSNNILKEHGQHRVDKYQIGSHLLAGDDWCLRGGCTVTSPLNGEAYFIYQKQRHLPGERNNSFFFKKCGTEAVFWEKK